MFNIGGTTINGGLIAQSIDVHGRLLFSTSEIGLRPRVKRDAACQLGDILALYDNGYRTYLVGVEIKDWERAIHPSIGRDYMIAYGACEYFYLAARKFSDSLFDHPSLGLFDLTRMQVVKKASYLYPDYRQRAHVVRGLKRRSGLYDIIEDPYQQNLSRYAQCTE